MERNRICCLKKCLLHCFCYLKKILTFWDSKFNPVTYIWAYFVFPEPDIFFASKQRCLRHLRPHLLRWDLPPGPAARSRSADHWWLPGTAGSVLCFLSSLLQIRRCKNNRNRGQWKLCCTPANVPSLSSRNWCLSALCQHKQDEATKDGFLASHGLVAGEMVGHSMDSFQPRSRFALQSIWPKWFGWVWVPLVDTIIQEGHEALSDSAFLSMTTRPWACGSRAGWSRGAASSSVLSWQNALEGRLWNTDF